MDDRVVACFFHTGEDPAFMALHGDSVRHATVYVSLEAIFQLDNRVATDLATACRLRLT